MNEKRESELITTMNEIQSNIEEINDYLDELVKALKNINRTLESMEGKV